MSNDVEETITSELQHCKFAIQLEASIYGTSNILMANVRFHSSSMNDTVDEFQFTNYPEPDSKDETIFSC